MFSVIKVQTNSQTDNSKQKCVTERCVYQFITNWKSSNTSLLVKNANKTKFYRQYSLILLPSTKHHLEVTATRVKKFYLM